MNRAKTQGCLLCGESRIQLCCCYVPFQTVVGFMLTSLPCGLPFIGPHLGTEPADCPFSTPGFHVFIVMHSRQSLLPHRHMGAKPGKSHSDNRSTYLFNSVCQVISTKTRKRDIFYPSLVSSPLKSAVHFVLPYALLFEHSAFKSPQELHGPWLLCCIGQCRARPCAKTFSSNPDSVCARSNSEPSKVAEECVQLCGQGSLVSCLLTAEV